MGKNFDRKVADARAFEERLIAEGRHSDAEIVANLRRSALTVRGTLKTIHQDNMELRQRLGLPSFLDKPMNGDAGDKSLTAPSETPPA